MTNLISWSITYQWEVFICYLCALWSTKFFWDIFFRPPKPRSACSAQGCTNLKKYSCSSNNLPVCSMACYKKVQLIPRQTATAV